MRKEDEELLERLTKETEKEGLEFNPKHEPEKFHKVVKRLIGLPQHRSGRAINAKGPKNKLTTDDKDKIEAKTNYRSTIARLSGNVVIEFPQAEDAHYEPYNKPAGALKRIGNWIRKPKTWIEILTLLAVGYYAYLTQTLVGTSNKQLDFSQRPWVSEEVTLIPPFIFNNTVRGGTARLSLKNIGHSVATKVHPFCNLGVLKSGQPYISFEKRSCDSLGQQTDTDSTAGYILFPDEELTSNEGVALSPDDTSIMKGDKASLLVLTCCVDYRSGLDERHHQTRRLYMVGTPQPPPSVGLGQIIPPGTFPQLVLDQLFWGNSAD